MEVKLKLVVESYRALETVCTQNWTLKLSWTFSRVMRKVKPIVEDFQAAQNKLLKELGTLIEDPSGATEQYRLEKDERERYSDQMDDLLDVDIDLDLNQIKIDTLLEEDVSISAVVLSDLHWLIVE